MLFTTTAAEVYQATSAVSTPAYPPTEPGTRAVSIAHPEANRLEYSAAVAVLALMFVSFAVTLSGAALFWKRSSRRVGTPPQRATYEALHTASMAVSALRGGLTADTAIKAAPALRQLLGTPVVAIADQTGLVGCEGSDRHAHALNRRLQDVLSSGRPQLLSASDLCCGHGGDCPCGPASRCRSPWTARSSAP